MKLVVGLGNPGPRYAATRHNVGARVVERLAERRGVVLEAAPFGDARTGRFGAGWLGDQAVGLLLPGTFMNESGAPVAAALAAHPVSELVVAYDDVDLPFGRLRLRAGGGSGGHRGLADTVARLEALRAGSATDGSGPPAGLPEEVGRLRFGVGRPPVHQDTTAYVLEAFAPAEERALPGLLDRAAEAIECGLTEGLAEAMNRFNAADPGPDEGEPPH